MKKCPKCELQWIQDADEMCDVCREEMISSQKAQSKKPRPVTCFNESFTFMSGIYRCDGKVGYKAFNSKGEHVGIVFMTDDPRTPAYKHCELHFFPQYYNQYGEWHRITSHGKRILWKTVCDYLKTHENYECFVD